MADETAQGRAAEATPRAPGATSANAEKGKTVQAAVKGPAPGGADAPELHPELQRYVEGILPGIEATPEERKATAFNPRAVACRSFDRRAAGPPRDMGAHAPRSPVPGDETDRGRHAGWRGPLRTPLGARRRRRGCRSPLPRGAPPDGAGATPRCGGTAGWLACDAADYGSDYEADESTCDRKDNDCDGTVDEGCCSQVCDLAPQCGCALDEACYPTTTADVNGCMPSGAGVEGDDCTEHSDCQPGLACLGSNGQCRQTCVDDSVCDPAQGSRCVLTFSGLAADVCSLACDPITQQGCQGGDGCYVLDDPGGDVTNCAPSGSGTSGASCTSSNNCAAGYSCVGIGGNPECRETCVVGGPATCTTGICQGITPSVVIGTTTYGICL